MLDAAAGVERREDRLRRIRKKEGDVKEGGRGEE
jgi:hypothetical protein